jgi:hypothetical protein
MHTRRYDEYIEGQEEDIYQEEIEVDQNFIVFGGADLIELDTGDVHLLDEEAGPSNTCLRKSKSLLERQKRRERLVACVVEADSDARLLIYNLLIIVVI